MNDAQVLIVDDDPAVRQIIAALLRRDGIESDFAADGESAMQRLGERTYRAVVLDLLMPRVDGRAVIEFMRQHGIETPVIVVSAVPDEQELDPQLVRVAMQKPFEPRELRTVVNAVLMRTGRPGRE
jgi:two-component system alkaline phosphatase synthesis response regulator PhoP